MRIGAAPPIPRAGSETTLARTLEEAFRHPYPTFKMNAPLRLFSLLVLALALSAGARAQDCAAAPYVTVDEINEIPEANMNTLMAEARALSGPRVRALLTNNLEGHAVRFTAVVLAAGPSAAGTASDAVPARRVFVRDTISVSQGTATQTIPLADARGTGLLDALVPGEVVDVCGTVRPRDSGVSGKSLRVEALAVTLTGALVDAADPLRQPVVVAAADLQRAVADKMADMNWPAYSRLAGEYVRIEGAPGSAEAGGSEGFLAYEGDGRAFTLVPAATEAPPVAAEAEARDAEALALAGPAAVTTLDPAWPNPVRGAAQVRYTVAEAGPVRLAVYDATGREIVRLVDGPLAADAYEAALDARELAPGAYVLRLTAGPTTLTRRMTVVR